MPLHPRAADQPIAADDGEWADLLSPARRRLLASAGLAAGGLASTAPATAAAHGEAVANLTEPGRPGFRAIVPPPSQGRSPWGQATSDEPTPRPASVRPGEASLPHRPRAYTDIKSYHAHIYFDEDSYAKAALLRRWAAERFPVELGNWNLEPRGPHVTPSFYFGFSNDLLPVLVPWLQLNSLGLTILIHPNTGDGRADHLYYTLWVNRTQPVNAYNWPTPEPGHREALEEVFPNVVPTVPLEIRSHGRQRRQGAHPARRPCRHRRSMCSERAPLRRSAGLDPPCGIRPQGLRRISNNRLKR